MRWSGRCPSARLIKSPLWCVSISLGLSQMDPGVNGHRQRAISSDLIYTAGEGRDGWGGSYGGDHMRAREWARNHSEQESSRQ